MKIAYRGNHSVPYSTESHIAESLRLLGHDVIACQENEVDWSEQVRRAESADAFAWTSTYGYAHNWPQEAAHAAVDKLNGMLPTFAVHLDLFFGLDRAPQVTTEPWFRLGHVFTADGDHDDDFAAAGVNHRWSPPAVFGPECGRGTARDEYRSDVAFVGSWRHYGHPEWWPHRKRMLHYLRRRYRGRLGLWPQRGAVRGDDLNDLYASVKVVVGDSCFADRAERYFSDRLFETVGRGGFVVFPAIAGAMELLPEGCGVAYYPPGDLEALAEAIDWWVAHDDEREEAIDRGIAEVRRAHTYEHRMIDVLAAVTS